LDRGEGISDSSSFALAMLTMMVIVNTKRRTAGRNIFFLLSQGNVSLQREEYGQITQQNKPIRNPDETVVESC